MSGIAFVNGKYFPLDEARFPILDLSVTRGYALCATIRTYEKEPFHWEKHLERLQIGAKRLHLPFPLTKASFYSILKKLSSSLESSEWVLKIVLSGGPSFSMEMETEPSIAIFSTPYVPYPSSFYKKGVELATFSYERFLPEHKTSSYFPAIWAKLDKKEIFEVLYLSKEKEILECATSNLFCVKKGKLITPSSKIYPGVTREIVLSLEKVEQRTVFYEELEEIEEVFLVATNKEIIPIHKVDSFSFSPGSVTKRVQQAFTEYVRKKEWIRKEKISKNNLVCF